MRRGADNFVSVALALCICAFYILCPASAETPTALRHGIEIAAANVGPAAAGYRNLKTYTGSAIRDGKSYSFAREVNDTATYDGFAVAGPHLLIEGAAFTSALDVYSSKPVVLRGVSLRPEAHSPVALMTRPGAGPVYLLWSELGARGAAAVGAGFALRADNATVFRSHISNAADGIDISGSQVRILQSLIETRAASAGDHNDALQLLGAPDDIEIAGNKILNRNPQTSCLYILGRNIRVQSNYLAGGGWTIYGGANNNGHGKGAASAVTVSDTIFGRDFATKSGHFGPVSYWDPSNTWTNNRFSDGTPVSP